MDISKFWYLSHRGDPDTRAIADRHYNRQKVGTKGFVPPGRCLVLRTFDYDAFWVTSFPYGEYVLHEWAGAAICSAFRNEAQEKYLSSDLVREAVACSIWMWKELVSVGMITFINESKILHKRDPGRCFLKAGFKKVGRTKKENLITLQLLEMPEPLKPQIDLVSTPVSTILAACEADMRWSND